MNLTKGSFNYKMNDYAHGQGAGGKRQGHVMTAASHCTLGRQPRGPQSRDVGKDVGEV